jgi:hypothetical protein
MTITGSGRVTRPPKVLYTGTDPVPAKKRKPKKKKIVVVKKSGPGAKVFAAPVITPLKSSYDTSPMEDDVVSINDVSLGGGGEGEGATMPTREYNETLRAILNYYALAADQSLLLLFSCQTSRRSLNPLSTRCQTSTQGRNRHI